MFACEHFACIPDILVIGKGLGGGIMPMAAMIARTDLDIGGEVALGHYTHEKSPVGAAAALATLDVIAEEGLVERSRKLGEHGLDRLRAMAGRQPLLAEARGLGLYFGVEIRRRQHRDGQCTRRGAFSTPASSAASASRSAAAMW